MRKSQEKKAKDDEKKKKRMQSRMKQRMIEEIEQHGFFLEPTQSELENPIDNFELGGVYERIDLVMDSGAFISSLPKRMFNQYVLHPLGPTLWMVEERRLDKRSRFCVREGCKFFSWKHKLTYA